MDLPSLARDLDKIATADVVVADSYVRYALRKAALYFIASLLAVIGLGLVGTAMFWLLSDSLGPIAAAALVGGLGCLIAGITAAIAMLLQPAREFSIAMEMRRSALTTLEQNVEPAPLSASSAYLYPAGEALISSVILPLLGVLIRNLKSSHEHPAEKAPADLYKVAEGSSPLDAPAPKA